MDDDLDRQADGTRPSDFTAGLPSIDDVLVALAHRRRRDTLRCLRTHEEPMPLEAVADEVAGEEDRRATSSSGVDRVLVALHHRHLPALDEAGIVEYDPDSNVVALSEDAPSVESILSAVEE